MFARLFNRNNNKISKTQFINAAKNGGQLGLATVQRYIEVNRDSYYALNVRDREKNTALIWAIKNGHEPIVDALLACSNIEIEIRNHEGCKAADIASVRRKFDIVTKLIAHGAAKGNVVTSSEFIYAAKRGKEAGLRVVKYYLAEYPDSDRINNCDREGHTALWWAACAGNVDIVTLLLAQPTTIIDKTNIEGLTPAQAARRTGYYHIAVQINAVAAQVGGIVTVEQFIEGARVGGEFGLKLVKHYMQHNPNITAINVCTHQGYNALCWAARNGHEDIVNYLLDQPNIDINAMNADGFTAAQEAQRHDQQDIAILINARAADRGARVKSSVFLEAAKRGRQAGLTLVQHFINQNRNNVVALNATDVLGNTALILAAINGHPAIVDALLAHPGINLDKVNYHHQRTAAQEAVIEGRQEIAIQIETRIAERLAGIAIPVIPQAEEKPVKNALQVAELSFKEQLQGIYQGEFPSHFCCPITFELMEDPITPYCGITFDRKSLVDLFKLKGNPDELPWAQANGVTIKKSELTMPTSKIFKNMIQEFVDEKKEKYKNNSVEGVASGALVPEIKSAEERMQIAKKRVEFFALQPKKLSNTPPSEPINGARL